MGDLTHSSHQGRRPSRNWAILTFSPFSPPHPCYAQGMSDEEAFKQSVECITGVVSRVISTKVCV